MTAQATFSLFVRKFPSAREAGPPGTGHCCTGRWRTDDSRRRIEAGLHFSDAALPGRRG